MARLPLGFCVQSVKLEVALEGGQCELYPDGTSHSHDRCGKAQTLLGAIAIQFLVMLKCFSIQATAGPLASAFIHFLTYSDSAYPLWYSYCCKDVDCYHYYRLVHKFYWY